MPLRTTVRPYALFLGNELKDEDAVIFVAERDSAVVGYIYAAIEPQLQWKDPRDRAAFVHDVVVDVRSRRSGIETAPTGAAIDWLRERGVARVMLWTSSGYDAARAVFAGLGFRKTTIEMMREL